MEKIKRHKLQATQDIERYKKEKMQRVKEKEEEKKRVGISEINIAVLIWRAS